MNCTRVHAYFPELCSIECSREAFDGLCFTGCGPLLGASLAVIYSRGEDLDADRLVRSSIELKCKQLRLVDGRLQVVGFSYDISVIKRPKKYCPRKKKQVSWSEVLHYLLK